MKWFDSLFLIFPIGLILFQWPYLDMGHFWDEAWVYAPAVRSMAETVPSIMPDAIPSVLSRGHPLLFQFLGGLWMKVFGESNFSAHVFATLISSCTLLGIYLLVRYLISWIAGMAACALVVSQPIFLAASGMLYPEMLMSLGLIITIYGYSKGKSWLFALGQFLAIYSKESAVVFFIAFVCWDGLLLILKRKAISDLRIHIIPTIIVLSHPLLQYVYHGWFLYPNHTDLISIEPKSIRYHARMIYRNIFEDQNRGWFAYTAIAIAVFSINWKKWWWPLLLIIIGFSGYKVFVWKWVVPDFLFPIIMMAGIAAPFVFWILNTKREYRITEMNNFFGLVFIVLIGFILFSSINFFTPRYLLVTIILLCTASIVAVWKTNWLPQWAKHVISVAMIGVSLHSTSTERTVGEINLGLYDELEINHRLANWMIENVDRDAVLCSNFVTNHYLRDHQSGYVESWTFFYADQYDICKSCGPAEYVIVTATVGCPHNLDLENDYRLEFETSKGASFAKVFKRATIL